MGVYRYVWGKLAELKEYLVFAYKKEKDWIAWEYVNDICCFESSCFLLAFENNQ